MFDKNNMKKTCEWIEYVTTRYFNVKQHEIQNLIKETDITSLLFFKQLFGCSDCNEIGNEANIVVGYTGDEEIYLKIRENFRLHLCTQAMAFMSENRCKYCGGEVVWLGYIFWAVANTLSSADEERAHWYGENREIKNHPKRTEVLFILLSTITGLNIANILEIKRIKKGRKRGQIKGFRRRRDWECSPMRSAWEMVPQESGLV